MFMLALTFQIEIHAQVCVKKEDFFSKLTLSGISTLPRRSYVVFPAEACKVSLMNLRKPRESLISPNFLNFSLTFSSGLKSQTSIRKLSCSTLFTSLPKKVNHEYINETDKELIVADLQYEIFIPGWIQSLGLVAGVVSSQRISRQVKGAIRIA